MIPSTAYFLTEIPLTRYVRDSIAANYAPLNDSGAGNRTATVLGNDIRPVVTPTTSGHRPRQGKQCGDAICLIGEIKSIWPRPVSFAFRGTRLNLRAGCQV